MCLCLICASMFSLVCVCVTVSLGNNLWVCFGKEFEGEDVRPSLLKIAPLPSFYSSLDLIFSTTLITIEHTIYLLSSPLLSEGYVPRPAVDA